MLQEQNRRACPHPIKPYLTSYDGKATRHLLESKRRKAGIYQHKAIYLEAPHRDCSHCRSQATLWICHRLPHSADLQPVLLTRVTLMGAGT